MWNMQSGKQRKSFNVGPPPPEVVSRGFGTKRKDRSIVGLASDVLDRVVVACTLDGTLNVSVVYVYNDEPCDLFFVSSSIFIQRHSTTSSSFHPPPPKFCCSETAICWQWFVMTLWCAWWILRLIVLCEKWAASEDASWTLYVACIIMQHPAHLHFQAFSPDSRWLIATSLDSSIRTFDVPTGRLIDIFRTASVATSVAFSPTGDFLATAHVDSVGVYLW
jgi:U3 small nucleolar RNA-associated protein 21